MKTWKQAVNEAFEIRAAREYAITIEKHAITIHIADDVKCVTRRNGKYAEDAAFEGAGVLPVDDILRRVRSVYLGSDYSGISPTQTNGTTAALFGFIGDDVCRMSQVALRINIAAFALAWEMQPWRIR